MADPVQIDRLLEDLRRTGRPAPGAHVSDDQAVLYSTEALTPGEQASVDAHLANCQNCAARMEHLLSAVEHWRVSDGRDRLNRLSERLHTAGTDALALFQDFVESVTAAAALPVAAASAVSVSSRDGFDHVAVEDTVDGDLIVRISSRRTELAGSEWEIEPFAHVVRLATVSPTEVGVEVRITRLDRATVAPHVALRIVPARRRT